MLLPQKLFVLVGLTFSLSVGKALSEFRSVEPVESSDLFEASGEITFKRRFPSGKRKSISREIVVDCLVPNTPGKVKNADETQIRFQSYSSLVRSLRRNLRRRYGSPRNAPLKLQGRLSMLKAITKSDLCEAYAVPSPSPSPSPTPVAEPNFDESGNVTAAGKIAFQIPETLEANIFVGEAKHISTCQTCHEPRGLFYSFEALRVLTLTTMGISEEQLPDSDLADIVAYLNRLDV